MLLIVDANVLIDYVLTDETILALAANHLGSIHVLREVVDEVDQIDEAECDQLGLIVVDPSVDQLLEAGREAGPLAFADRLCLILARENGWTCVTNDRPLHRACADAGVATMWGLELLLELVAGGHLGQDDALRVAELIRDKSGGRVTEAIMDRFREEVAARGQGTT